MIGEKDYSKNIEKLIQATSNGKMEWIKTNPTTFIYKTVDKNGYEVNFSIQEVKYVDPIMEISETRYIFQVIKIDQRVKSKKVILNLESENSDTFEILLAKLYEKVSYMAEKKNIDYFNDLIEDL